VSARVDERISGESANATCEAMYMQSAKESMRIIDDQLYLIMPFAKDNDFKWPFMHPRNDTGKYVVGLFEAGTAANGVRVHAVACWTTLDELLPALSKVCGRQVLFKSTSPDEYSASLPSAIAEDLTQTMLLVGSYSYYGPGEEKRQQESDRWMAEGTWSNGLENTLDSTGPWNFT
jgi:hypothetical protein